MAAVTAAVTAAAAAAARQCWCVALLHVVGVVGESWCVSLHWLVHWPGPRGQGRSDLAAVQVLRCLRGMQQQVVTLQLT